jgi:hypothetical protein
MNKIVLEKIQSSGNVKHIKLLINDNDVGILYLKEEEVDIIFNCLKQGKFESETVLETDLFDSEDDFEEEE